MQEFLHESGEMIVQLIKSYERPFFAILIAGIVQEVLYEYLERREKKKKEDEVTSHE